jgi:hypothetical protein
MTRFVVIATAMRGAVNPPEPLGDAEQYRANMAAQTQDAADDDSLLRRATMHVQLERDPILTTREIYRRKPVDSDRVDEMVRLARIAK